jgi:hypothetical protein
MALLIAGRGFTQTSDAELLKINHPIVSGTQLHAQDAILFDQVLERVRLLAIQPAIKTANQIWSADMSITTRVGQDLAISGKHFQSA